MLHVVHLPMAILASTDSTDKAKFLEFFQVLTNSIAVLIC